MKKLSVYLAGPITEVSEDESTKWRSDFKNKYSNIFEIKNPIERDSGYDGLNFQELCSVVANDERIDILNCDAIIAYLNYPSMGTAMGIMYAFLSGRTVVAVRNTPDQKISKMVYYHTHCICDNFDEAVAYIKKRHGRSSIKMIMKRDGRAVKWTPEKIENAIQAAIDATYSDSRKAPKVKPPNADKLATTVVMQIEDALEKGIISHKDLSIEFVQDMVEKILMDNAHRSEVNTLAKSYILYRRKRQEIREKFIDDGEAEKFVTEVLHDIKSPTGNIDRYCQFLQDSLKKNNTIEASEYLKSIEEEQQRILKLIVESRRRTQNKYRMEVIKLQQFIDKQIETYRDSNIQFHNIIPDDFSIKATPDKLTTIIRNLIDNSIRYGFNETVKGNIYIESYMINEGNIAIEYWNDGNTITESDAGKVFDETHKGSETGVSFHFGMGQVKRYIEQLGGDIECIAALKESLGKNDKRWQQVENGIPLFRISLPIYRGKGDEGKRLIMVADNEPGDRKMMTTILKMNNFDIVEAGTIKDALDIAREKNLYGAVLDIDFKEEKNGIWLLKEIMKTRPDTKVIIVTGSKSSKGEDLTADALKYGAMEVFDKNYNPKQILACFE